MTSPYQLLPLVLCSNAHAAPQVRSAGRPALLRLILSRRQHSAGDLGDGGIALLGAGCGLCGSNSPVPGRHAGGHSANVVRGATAARVPVLSPTFQPGAPAREALVPIAGLDQPAL